LQCGIKYVGIALRNLEQMSYSHFPYHNAKLPIMKTSLFRCSLALITLAVSPVAHANTALWIGNPGVTANTNWSDNANWNNVGVGGAGYNNNDVVFGGTGSVGTAATVSSVADVSAQAFSMNFTNGPGQFHTILIPAGTTLTNANSLSVGTRTADAYTTVVGLAGGGTFLQNGGNITNQNYGSAASTALATLDMSGLTNFVYSNSSGAIHIGGTGGNRSAGSLSLAAVSNHITVGTLNLATHNGANAATSSLRLGTGTNVINVGTFNIVNNKNSATLNFIGGTGGLRLRGVGGTDTDRANFTIANRNQTGTGTATGTLALNGHPVDIKAGNMTVGQNSASSSVNTGTGVVQFDTGTIDVTNLTLAVCSNPNAGAVANGTVNVGNGASGATLVVGAGGISLVNVTGTTLGTATGTLNVNGGAVQVSGLIKKTTTAGSANINITSGTLNMNGLASTIGSPAAPIDNVTLNNSTLTLPVQNGIASAVVTTLNINGTTDTINISSLPGIASFPAQFPVISYAGMNGAYDFVLGALPATYQGYLSNNSGTLSVDIVITNSLAKTDTWRGNVSSNWDVSTLNWSFSGSPANYQEGDAVVFDDSLTGTTNVNLATNVFPSAISFNNTSTNYVLGGTNKISGTATLAKSGVGTVTLSQSGGDDFIGGVFVSDGTLILDNTNSAISGGVTINSGTLQIGKNDGNGNLPGGAVTDNGVLSYSRSNNISLTVPVSGGGALVQRGSGTVSVTAAQQYTGSTVVSNGTLALSGSGTISNSTQVIVSSATLDVSALSQSLISSLNVTNATNTVTVNSSGAANILVNGLNVGGAANRINVAALPTIASYPVTFPIIQSVSPIAGTFNYSVGSLPAASPSYVGAVSESVDQLTVLLTLTAGPVGLRSGVVWSGADVPNLNTNWSDRLNWQLPGAPGVGENVFFNNTAAVAASAVSTPGGGSAAFTMDNVNNIVDANFTIAGLTFTNSSDTYHNTFIRSGKTLNPTNGLNIGVFDSGAGTHEFVTVSGANAQLTLSNNTNANLQVWVGNGSGGSQATLDLSALDTLNATVSRLLVGANIGNTVNRPSGILYLAKTNSITAGFQTTTFHSGTTTANAGIVVADCNQNAGSASTVYLGQVNTISADTIAIARQKANGNMRFNPIYLNTAPYPTVTFQGFSSSRVSIFDVGDGVGNTGTTSLNATNDLAGGIVTALVDTMDIGRASGPTSGTSGGTILGALTFEAGSINANNVNLGLQPTAVHAAKVGIGVLNVGSNNVIGAGATLTVNGTLTIAGAAVGGAGGTATTGTLNITNGTVLANNVVATNNLSGANAVISLYGGRLILTNAVGSDATPMSILNLLPYTPDNTVNKLYLPVGASNAALTVATFNLDAQDPTTNIINIESVGPLPGIPIELPLIKYGTMNFINGSTFNIGLGTLPTGYSGYLTNDTTQNMVALYLTAAANPQPRIVGMSQSGSNLTFSGTNGFGNRPYNVIASTNVSLPRSNWTAIATNIFAANGSFSFTTAVDPTKPTRFFAVQVVP
jgi:autotransporter-associated beta strand protein